MSDKEQQLDTPDIDDDNLEKSVNSQTPLNGDNDAYKIDIDENEINNTKNQKELDEPLMTPLSTRQMIESHSHHNDDDDDDNIRPHTPQSGDIDHSQSMESLTNPLDHTKLRHQGDDIEVGTIAIEVDQQNNSPIKPNAASSNIPPSSSPEQRRMPSISYNISTDKELAALRRASRRKWWSPTRLCDWCMHKLLFGKMMVMILTWTTVIDYAKDMYVAYHLADNEKWWEFSVTLCVLFLSLRLMLYLRATDDSGVSFWKLLIYYLPGSIYADFQIDRFSDVPVCLLWEFAILFGTPFVPFFLIYLALKKSISLFFCSQSFENPYLLSYAVVECIFETLPQLILQTYLYFAHNGEIETSVFIIAWIVSILVLIKIPIVVWYNWRIVYKLSFKRRHCGEIMSVKYHPIQDLIATGSWDHTVLINSIIAKGDEQHKDGNEIKAKRVLDHHYNINCIAFSPHYKSDIIAVAGQGIELFNWRMGKSIGQFPKNRERDQLRRKKRHRTKEVKEVCFSPDAKRLIWCQGKNVFVWDILEKRELLKIKVIQGGRLGDVESIDISPNGKYIACGLYTNQIKVYNSANKDLVRVLEGHTSAVMCVKFDRMGKYVISGGADYKIRVFDLRSGEQIKQFDGHTSDVMCIAIDYTNKYIASGGRDKTLFICEMGMDDLNKYAMDDEEEEEDESEKVTKGIVQMNELRNWTPYTTDRDILCCDFSPYGDTVACASEDSKVHILTLPKQCVMRSNKFSADFRDNPKIVEPNGNDEDEPENVRQFSNMDNIKTNDYNKFDPKEHHVV